MVLGWVFGDRSSVEGTVEVCCVCSFSLNELVILEERTGLLIWGLWAVKQGTGGEWPYEVFVLSLVSILMWL